MNRLVPFLAGVLFAVGLVLSGMTQPAKVIGFLDVAGQWDPSLGFVMLGAVAVFAVAYRRALRMQRPVMAPSFELPKGKLLDARLLIGSAVFGVGWGLAGYCPGPAIVSLGEGSARALLFVLAMGVGMVLYELMERVRSAADARAKVRDKSALDAIS
jgi:uncharacterized protein